MAPILGRLGPLIIYSFSLLWTLALMVALIYQWRGRPTQNSTRWLDLWLWLISAALVGGRIGFVLANLEYFKAEPGQMWRIDKGGLAYHGVLLGAGLVLWRWQKTDPGIVARLAIIVPWLHLAGWTACLLDGCGYGQTAPSGIWSAELPDQYGLLDLRLQTQAIGILGSLLVLLLTVRWHQVSPESVRPFWASWLMLGIIQAGLAMLRADPALMVEGWRLDFWLNVVVALLAAFALSRQNRMIE